MEMTVGEEIIDVKIMIVIGMTVEREGDKTLEVSVMIEVDWKKEVWHQRKW